MANGEHVALLRQGIIDASAWNAWRDENRDIQPDLMGASLPEARLGKANFRNADLRNADLSGADLREADLSGGFLHGADLRGAVLIETNLSGADLSEANLSEAKLHNVDLSRSWSLRGANLSSAKLSGANLSGANLSGANLYGADLYKANLSGADLSGAGLWETNLRGANLSEADLSGASLGAANLGGANLYKAKLYEAHLGAAFLGDAKLIEAELGGANLERATLVDTDLTGADLTGCRIYGVSAWSVKLERATQQNLIITNERPEITVDNMEVAQFVYLMMNNQRIRDVIDTITSKAVLILGRFTDERMAVLNALREELRNLGYLPILFEFEKSTARNTDETITLLARMARFVIADISDAKSVLHELRAIVPDLPSVPVQAIILKTQEEPGMFDFYRGRPSFLKVHRYSSKEQLIKELGQKVIRPAELKVRKLRGVRSPATTRRCDK
jgi:uncharacterized protein YjbI with pentapeptide repeats